MSRDISDLEVFKFVPELKVKFHKIVNMLKHDYFLVVDDLDNSPHSAKILLLCWTFNRKTQKYEHGFITVLRPLTSLNKFGLGELYLGFDKMVHISPYIVKDIILYKSDLVGKKFDDIMTLQIRKEQDIVDLNILCFDQAMLNQH